MARINPAIMETVAGELLGEPNQKLSSTRELRYGNRGSLSVDLEKGTYYDHEAGEGGGVLDLIRRKLGLVNGAAFDWLEAEGLAANKPRRDARHVQGSDRGGLSLRGRCGAHAYDVVRLRKPKDFRQRAPDGSWSTKGIRRRALSSPGASRGRQGRPRLLRRGREGRRPAAELWLGATSSPGGRRQVA